MDQVAIFMKIESLVKKYGQNLAVDKVDLNICQGEIFGLVGPDGAGKSTLLRLMSLLVSPTSGKIEILRKNMINNSKIFKKSICYLSQGLSLYEDLTVWEHLVFTAKLYGISQKKFFNIVSQLMKRINLGDHLNKLAGELSGGLKQKLALMCCLLPEPEALFLDEPNTGVDPLSRREFWQLLYEINQDGVTVVISTSYMDEAELCHRLAFMHKGKIIALGTSEELKENFSQKIYELTASDPRQIYGQTDLLKNHFYIRVQGEAIRLVCEADIYSKEEIIQKLKEFKISFISLRSIEPNMEDVFMFKLRTLA